MAATAYDLLRQRCGLSQAEAAALHGTRLDTVKQWGSGKSLAPIGVVRELRELHRMMAGAARPLAIAIMEHFKSGRAEILVAVAESDAHAKRLGFPCASAHAATVGLALALVQPSADVDVVPYRPGGTALTARGPGAGAED